MAVSEAEEGGGRGTLALVGDLATSAAASVASMTREALMGRPGGYRAGAAPALAPTWRLTFVAPKDAARAGRSRARYVCASRCGAARLGTLVHASKEQASCAQAAAWRVVCQCPTFCLTSAFRCSYQCGDACERLQQSCQL